MKGEIVPDLDAIDAELERAEQEFARARTHLRRMQKIARLSAEVHNIIGDILLDASTTGAPCSTSSSLPAMRPLAAFVARGDGTIN